MTPIRRHALRERFYARPLTGIRQLPGPDGAHPGNPRSGTGPSGVHRGVQSGTRPPDRLDFSDSPLDLGIRAWSNARSRDPGDVTDGVANAHLENRGPHFYPDYPVRWRRTMR